MGNSSELVVLWESVVGLVLFRVLLLVVLVVLVLALEAVPVDVLRVEVCEVAAPVASVVCEEDVAVRTWLSLYTKCLACCSCVESWEKVYWRRLVCVTAGRWPRLVQRLWADTLVRALTSSLPRHRLHQLVT